MTTPKFERPEEEDYQLWLELNPCPECHGSGSVCANSPISDDIEMDCEHCNGTGIDPAATESCDDAED